MPDKLSAEEIEWMDAPMGPLKERTVGIASVDCGEPNCKHECNMDNDWKCSCGVQAVVFTAEALTMFSQDVANDIATDTLGKTQFVIPKLKEAKVKEGQPPFFSGEEVISIIATLLTGDPNARAVNKDTHEEVGANVSKIEVARSMSDVPQRLQKS